MFFKVFSFLKVTCFFLLFIFSTNLSAMSIKIMLYGDSLMAGYGLTQNENLSSVLMNIIKKNYMDIDLINARSKLLKSGKTIISKSIAILIIKASLISILSPIILFWDK